MKKTAFVIPWYGREIVGGAEALCANTAVRLAEAGLEVEVLATTVKDFHGDWGRDHHKPGETTEDGVLVRRFPVSPRDARLFDALNARLMATPEGTASPLTPEEERAFLDNSVNSRELCAFIEANHRDYGTIFFLPYMFGTTVRGMDACPAGRAALIPCLHDEPYAYMDIYRPMFKKARRLVFNVASERDLAVRLHNIEPERGVVAGVGVDTDWTSDPERFRKAHGITEPFLLYAGRREPTKNTPLLVDWFCRYLEAGGPLLKLVLMGGGRVDIPKAHKDHIVDLGFVPSQDKYDACGAALALCQPSTKESFSIVVMESWLAGRPVLAHADCPATKTHCLAADGGLFFKDYDEFEACVDFLLDHPDKAAAMGAQGRQHVLDTYAWPEVMGRYRQVLEAMESTPPARTLRIVTPSLRRGDAIGNYVLSLRSILRDKGFRVHIYADSAEPGLDALDAALYSDNPGDVLWFHYSIHSPNLEIIKRSKAFKIMDYHGVTPPELFAGFNPVLEKLVARGRRELPEFKADFDLCLAHSDFTAHELKAHGFAHIEKTPLAVHSTLGGCPADPVYDNHFSRLEYILFVGRIVPQKNIEGMVEFFARLKTNRPDLALVLAGDTGIAPSYHAKVLDLMRERGVEESALFMGHVTDPGTLASLFSHAAFTAVFSHWETFCVPIVESFFFGVPVIGVDAACIPEIVGAGGIILDPGRDAEAWAETVHSLWSDNEAYADLRRRAKDRAEAFMESSMAARLDRVLEERLLP